MSEAVEGKGARSSEEILSQPQRWSACLKELEGQYDQVLKPLGRSDEWIFIGCGSSYYVALSAAWSWTELTGIPAKAVPASEVLLYPDVILGTGKCQPVVISRSGSTSEAVMAAELLQRDRKIKSLAISCAEGKPLEKAVTSTLKVTAADEQSTVMTRSFTSMLLGLQGLAAWVGKRQDFLKSLAQMAGEAQKALESMRPRIEQFVNTQTFDDYVFLGQGPFFGLASEGHLKVTEMSCSYAQVFHTLEFRHGPKSIVSPRTLLTFFLAERSAREEEKVLEEMKALGGTTLVITNKASEKARAAADLVIELNLSVPELARLAPSMMASQLFGLYLGIRRGYDPDNPRNLTRVVMLEGKSA